MPASRDSARRGRRRYLAQGWQVRAGRPVHQLEQSGGSAAAPCHRRHAEPGRAAGRTRQCCGRSLVDPPSSAVALRVQERPRRPRGRLYCRQRRAAGHADRGRSTNTSAAKTRQTPALPACKMLEVVTVGRGRRNWRKSLEIRTEQHALNRRNQFEQVAVDGKDCRQASSEHSRTKSRPKS